MDYVPVGLSEIAANVMPARKRRPARAGPTRPAFFAFAFAFD